MKFSILKENLLIPMQQLVGVVEKRQTLAILSNVLIRSEGDQLYFTGTDLEVQVVARISDCSVDSFAVTVPARKLLDICRTLPEGTVLKIECAQDKFFIIAGRSRFSLATLPAENFPEFDTVSVFDAVFNLDVSALRRCLDKTVFAMGHQDVRYYLNGLLLDFKSGVLFAVATDGHRLALCEQRFSDEISVDRHLIVPRKGVLELQRLLVNVPEDAKIVIEVSNNTVRFTFSEVVFSVKLIDGRFPDYQRVLPKQIAWLLKIDRLEIKAALARVSVLCNEKFRGIHLELKPDLLKLTSQNPEHEEALEEIAVEYTGKPFMVGFNVSYLLDAINNIDSSEVVFLFTEDLRSCMLHDVEAIDFKFIVMPVLF